MYKRQTADHAEGACHHLGKPVPRGLVCDNLLRDRHVGGRGGAEVEGFFKKTLEGVSLLPEMLPSIVLVFGIMLFWNAIYKIIPLYNTIWIMVLAYVVLYLSYTVTSAFIGICPALRWTRKNMRPAICIGCTRLSAT